MYCPQCRTELPDDAKYCVKCGYDFARLKTPTPSGRRSTDPLDYIPTEIEPDSEIENLKTGYLFANRYEILSEGFRGGMGVVYKCKDTKLNKVVALKVIHPKLLQSRQAIERFRQEVAISQEFQHPNIAKVFDLQEWEGKEFFTMEWVEGPTLREVIRKRQAENRPFSLEEAYKIISQLSEALEHAHQRTVHRDIKPENILISNPPSPPFAKVGMKEVPPLEKGEAGGFFIKLTDFGIAKMLSPSQFTSTSIQMGTPDYMAPEQKKEAAQVDKRADVHAMGVVLFELLTLHNTRGLKGPSKINPSLPREIDDVIEKALEFRPEDRYEGARELADAFKKVIAGVSEQAEAEKREAEEQKRQRAEKQKREDERQKAEERERTDAEKKRLEDERNRIEREKKKIEQERAQAEGERIRQEQAKREEESRQKRLQEEARKKKSPVMIIGIAIALIIGVVIYAKMQQPVQTITQIPDAPAPAHAPVPAPQAKVQPAPIPAPAPMSEKPAEAPAPATVPKQSSFRDSVTGMEFVFVKGGCFQMGDTFGDGYYNEKPVHEVCVDDFYLGKYEVTVGEFKKFVDDTGYLTEAEKKDGCVGWTGSEWKKDGSYNWKKLGFAQNDRHPVACVSWNDTQEYIKWLNRKGHGNYRLPTEAEWEYAARGGTKSRNYWGDEKDDACRYANVADRAGKRQFSGWTIHECDDGYVFTAPVGKFQPNRYGLYDMSGNVSEWVSDWYGKDYYNNSPRSNPSGPDSGSYRVMRGGSWYYALGFVRASFRGLITPGFRCGDLGFRLAGPR